MGLHRKNKVSWNILTLTFSLGAFKVGACEVNTAGGFKAFRPCQIKSIRNTVLFEMQAVWINQNLELSFGNQRNNVNTNSESFENLLKSSCWKFAETVKGKAQNYHLIFLTPDKCTKMRKNSMPWGRYLGSSAKNTCICIIMLNITTCIKEKGNS